MTRRVVMRDDRRTRDDQQLLLRMNDDRDIGNVLKLALAFAPIYRVVPGFEPSGALTLSCFAVADELEAQIVVRGSRWSAYGLTSAGQLRKLGCELVATDIFDGEDLMPLSDRHLDVLVCAYPSGLADYASLNKAERARVRDELLVPFAAVLRSFDPRRSIGHEA
jgi:hypothetical protein